MPLFGRRSRSVSVSRPMPPATTSPAMMAASQAFQGNQGPQTKLATGAAAAALRTMSPANTPVSQVQTKRMVDRQGSVSSAQGAQRGRARGNNLQRRSSSSSMTERTFRNESPGRPSTSTGYHASRPTEPPVPPLPQTYADIPPVPKKSHRRSASIDDIQVRKNAQAKQLGNRNSIANFAAPTSTTTHASTAARRVASGPLPPQLDRQDSGSHNFSYPNRARPNSPPPQKQGFDSPIQPKGFSKASVSPTSISERETRNIQYDLAKVAQQPVKKKKKREGPLQEGSRLSTGTMGSKPTLTPLAPAPAPPMEEDYSPQDSGRGQNNARLTGQASHFPPSPVSPTESRESDSEGEPSRSRRTQRASGALQKQPSVVREDWEGERDDVPSSPIDSSPAPVRFAPSKRQAPEANVSRKIESSGTPSMPEHEDENTHLPQHLTTPQARKSSLSPSRSTRFSNRLSSDMTQGQKHEPLPRSVSPRKSAMKLSNSPQILPVDSRRRREPSLTPSEATDLSDTTTQRKKHAHVKFDTHPAVVGIAAETGSPISTQVTSPQNTRKDKKWFSSKKANRVVLSEDSDDEDAMKPRPALPTFGSVRNGRREVESVPSTTQRRDSSPSSSSTSSLSSDTRPTTMETSVSSDHALGGLLARDVAQKAADRIAPLPSYMTSVEESQPSREPVSIYAQDNDQQTRAVPPQATSTTYSQTTSPLQTVENASEVPRIAVLPATPGAEEHTLHQDQWLVEVPGGFPSAAPASRTSLPTSIYAAPNNAQPDVNPEASTDHSSYIPADVHHNRMPSIVEEESDRDSIYSDAAEDMSDLEGDGFGSIAAIVHRPAGAGAGPESTLPQSPATVYATRSVEEESNTVAPNWEDAEARWKDRKEYAQRASLQPAVDIEERPWETKAQRASSSLVPELGPKAPPSPASTVESNFSPGQSSTTSGATRAARASAQGGFKKSVRPPPEVEATSSARTDQAGMKKSMRAGTQGNEGPTMRGEHSGFKKSVRSAHEAPAAYTMKAGRNNADDEGTRPIRSSMRASAALPAQAAAAASPQIHGTLQKKNLRTSAPPIRQTLPPVNNDSDSESSFKRRRKARASSSGRHSMRRSMRAGEVSEPTRPSVDRNTVRSMSPVERRPFSAAGGQSTMRTSMRGANAVTPTLRGNQNEGKRSSSLFGRNKAKSPTRPMSSSGFGRSRFADSDDEGDSRPKVYRSRFQNSSDEEDNLPPVRGIPHRGNDADSTDLDDSSDEEKKRRKATQQKKLEVAVPPSPQTIERPTSPTSPETKKKRGLFGRMKKNKDDAPASPSDIATNGNSGVVVAPTTKAAVPSYDKDALLEQARKNLEANNQIRPTSPPPSSPARGKLQRRVTPSRVMSDSWPLPPKIPADNETVDRPYTSDGSNVPSRPGLGDRQTSSATAATSPMTGDEAFAKSGKKKRFPMLRKAFGLKN